MSTPPSVIRIAAAAVAACALAWLVANVNTHGDEVRTGMSSFLQDQAVRTRARQMLDRERESHWMSGGGLELVDMYQCMCGGPLSTDIRGWVGLWLVTVLIGGIPTAVLVRSEASRRRV